jgi:hypothetical protein
MNCIFLVEVGVYEGEDVGVWVGELVDSSVGVNEGD